MKNKWKKCMMTAVMAAAFCLAVGCGNRNDRTTDRNGAGTTNENTVNDKTGTTNENMVNDKTGTTNDKTTNDYADDKRNEGTIKNGTNNGGVVENLGEDLGQGIKDVGEGIGQGVEDITGNGNNRDNRNNTNNTNNVVE